MDKEQVEKESHTVSFTIVNNKTVLFVRTGETRLLKIILDSGMGWDGLLVYNPDIRDSIRLINPVAANVGGAGQGSAPSAIFSDSMSYSIGNMEFDNQRMVILQNESFRGFPSDGVIGNTLLGHYAVEVNYDDSTLTMHDPGQFSPDESWTALPVVFMENNIPWIDVSIVIGDNDPISVACYIDYASSEAIELLLKDGQKFTIPDETREVYLGRGLSGDIYGKKGKISKVIIGPFEVENVEAAFTPAGVRSKQQGADGVIASGLLRRFNLVFDYTHSKLYLKPNAHFNELF